MSDICLEKKNKSTSYNQGIMSKLILYDENIWIHFVCLQRLGLDVGDKFWRFRLIKLWLRVIYFPEKHIDKEVPSTTEIFNS